MPRGKFTNHKGRSRRFTNPEELEQQRRREEKESQWRRTRGDESSDDEDEESGPSGDKKGKASKKGAESGDSSGSGSGSDSDSEEESDEGGKAKGVSNLIQVENPNRVQKKAKKLASLNTDLAAAPAAKPELSRREREEIEKVRAQAHYQKLHAEGKTEQARADLARLAIIKQQREEAAKRRDAEKKQKEDAAKQKTAQTQKALGKK